MYHLQLPQYYFFIIFFVLLYTLNSCQREETSTPFDDGIPPNIPTKLKVYLESDGEIGIEWNRNNEIGIEGYNIYRGINDSINFEKISFTLNDWFEEYSLDYDSIYYYKISAIDIFGLESNLTDFVNAKPINRFIPYPISNIIINARNWEDSISIYLNWRPAYNSDIKEYAIYRSTKENFEVNDSFLVGFTNTNTYEDTKKLNLLTRYHYSIVSVDKGNLKSKYNTIIDDIIFDLPVLIYPEDNEETNYFFEFRIKTISLPATYNLIVQRNKYFDVIYNKEFYADDINHEIEISMKTECLEPYKKYFWRIVTYSKNNYPNSISKLNSFTIIP
ncbi:fibronectin type III domain-containing protein [Bacteroidota bacterium]